MRANHKAPQVEMLLRLMLAQMFVSEAFDLANFVDGQSRSSHEVRDYPEVLSCQRWDHVVNSHGVAVSNFLNLLGREADMPYKHRSWAVSTHRVIAPQRNRLVS